MALKEIRKFQKSTNLLIPRSPFIRLIRSITYSITAEDMKYQGLALVALQVCLYERKIGTLEKYRKFRKQLNIISSIFSKIQTCAPFMPGGSPLCQRTSSLSEKFVARFVNNFSLITDIFI
jgi:histone H3/H4